MTKLKKLRMGLQSTQSEFVRAVAFLIQFAYSLGYELTFGDAYRDPRCGYGSSTSAHHNRLAIDFNLFKNGVYLTDSSDHSELGIYWERLGGIWGGRFSNPDGNHYEWPK